MYIVIAPDSFKGCCSSRRAGELIERGVLRVFPDSQTDIIPVGDGGEGTVDAVIDQLGGYRRNCRVTGPLGLPVNASYGIAGETAVIEMAAASGLTLLSKDQQDPRITTTYGTGELMKDALEEGCTVIFLALGGSATNDGGAGMAQALGASFVDKEGKEISFGGLELKRIEHIDLTKMHPGLKQATVKILSDVSNPLCGENGASHVFSPQKGADQQTVRELDAALSSFAARTFSLIGRDFSKTPGSGAAGGLGFALLAFTGGQISSGIDAVLELIGFSQRIRSADLVITGEGSMDRQSGYGKAPGGVARAAHAEGIPVIAVVGSLGGEENVLDALEIDAVISSIQRPMTINEALDGAESLIANAAEQALRLISLGMFLSEGEP